MRYQMKAMVLLLSSALTPSAWSSWIGRTRVDDAPPRKEDAKAWAEAARSARGQQARALRAIIARAKVEICAPDNWVHVDERGVVCAHPNYGSLNIHSGESAFLDQVLISAAAIGLVGYALVAPSADPEGDGYVLAAGSGKVNRKTICLLIEEEQRRRDRARKAAKFLDDGAAALKP